MRNVLIFAALMAMVGCGSVSESEQSEQLHRRDPLKWNQIAERAKTVRLTSNPEAVRDCKFLGNVKSVGHETRSTWDIQWKTAALGGNTLFATNTKPGREFIADAYACEIQR